MQTGASQSIQHSHGRERSKSWQGWILALVPSVVALVITLQVLPFFGNMDDSVYVALAGSRNPLAFASTLFDPANGFTRWASWLVVWPAAWLGDSFGAEAYFLANVVVSSACILAFGCAYGRYAAWKSRWSIAIFAGIAFAWPYTAELFFFPSLQEKGVILGAALVILWIAISPSAEQRWVQYASLLLVSGIAFTTKTQILLLVPGMIAALWITPKQRTQSLKTSVRITATAVWTVASAVVLWVARNGVYSSSTQGGVGGSFDFVSDRRFQAVAAVTAAYAVALGIRWARKKFTWSDVVPLVFLVSVCGAFGVWEIRNYYLSVFSVALGVTVVAVLEWFAKDSVRVVGAVVAVLLASSWLIYRLPQVYVSLGSIRTFLESSQARALDAQGETIYVSCEEAPVHFNKYADAARLDELVFATVPLTNTESVRFLLADSRLCPWPGAVATPGWTALWPNPAGVTSGYVLYGRDG